MKLGVLQIAAMFLLIGGLMFGAAIVLLLTTCGFKSYDCTPPLETLTTALDYLGRGLFLAGIVNAIVSAATLMVSDSRKKGNFARQGLYWGLAETPLALVAVFFWWDRFSNTLPLQILIMILGFIVSIIVGINVDDLNKIVRIAPIAQVGPFVSGGLFSLAAFDLEFAIFYLVIFAITNLIGAGVGCFIGKHRSKTRNAMNLHALDPVKP